MKNENSAYTDVRKILARVLVIILLMVLLTQVMADNQQLGPLRPSKASIPESEKQRIAGRLASGYGLGSFRPSLEMKENADFLLTPALLVQEAISEDVIITYPTE